MKIGILVPCYNVEKYIKQCLDSLINQTYEDIHIYLRDDVSTDSTREIIGEYLRSLPKEQKATIGFLKGKGNLGWCGNFNELAHIAIKQRCEALYLMNSDDKLEPNAIEKLEKLLVDGISWVNCSGAIINDLTNDVIGQHTPLPNATPQNFIHQNRLTSFALIRSSVWKAMGGYDTSISYADWELWIRLLKKGYQYAVTHEPLYIYRSHSEQVSKKTNHQAQIKLIHKLHFKNLV